MSHMRSGVESKACVPELKKTVDNIYYNIIEKAGGSLVPCGGSSPKCALGEVKMRVNKPC